MKINHSDFESAVEGLPDGYHPESLWTAAWGIVVGFR